MYHRKSNRHIGKTEIYNGNIIDYKNAIHWVILQMKEELLKKVNWSIKSASAKERYWVKKGRTNEDHLIQRMEETAQQCSILLDISE